MSDTSNNGRWVKLHLSMLDWEWHDMPEMVSLFVHLIMLAQHKDYVYRGHTLKRGQLMTSRAKLAEVTGMSEQTIRTCLARLESTNEITKQSTNRNTLITICNYERYQLNPNEVNQLNNQQVNHQSTNHQTRYKEDNIEVDVVTRTREKAFNVDTVENMCMSLGVDAPTYLTLAEQVFAEWAVAQSGDRDIKHFISTMRIKVDAWRRAQRENQPKETPLERRKRAEREAMTAAALNLKKSIK